MEGNQCQLYIILSLYCLIILNAYCEYAFAKYDENHINDPYNWVGPNQPIKMDVKLKKNIMSNNNQQEGAQFPHETLLEVHDEFIDDYMMYKGSLNHVDNIDDIDIDHNDKNLRNFQNHIESNNNYKHYSELAFQEPLNKELNDNFQESHVHQPRLGIQPAANNDLNIVLVPGLGLVRGIYAYQTIENRLISAYLGLKYGTVKPGLGRFQKASSLEKYDNKIDASKEPENCPQYPDVHLIVEREKHGENVDDCLTLNIYKPAKAGSYPILVFIHGEMLFDGSAFEGQPDYFLEYDIILITVNYRLAPFGYLTTLNDAMPGNVALADIHMALEWIQQYVRAFHGNPEQITLMGQASGATLIHALSLSGQAHGLFHKLILQSGTALNPYYLDEQPLNTIRSFAHFSRCPARRTVDGFLNCFEHMTTSQILKNFKIFREIYEPRGFTLSSGYKLTVGDHLGYLPYHPYHMLTNNLCPLIIGSTKDAGAFILSRFYNQLTVLQSNNISDYINIVLKFITHPRYYQVLKNWAVEHIFNRNIRHEQPLNTVTHKLLELINLVLYRGPIIDSIRYTSKKIPTYMFSFDYRGEYHRYGHLPNVLPFEVDASLSDDSAYLFPYPQAIRQLNDEDKKMARSMVHIWTQFVQYKAPKKIINDAIIWPNVSSEYGPFLRFMNNPYDSKPDIIIDYHFTDGVPVPKLYPGNDTFSHKTSIRQQ